MTAARQRGLVRALALVVLLGAILPNVTYLGHWTVRGLESVTAEAVDGHKNHCHGSSSCADQAGYGLQWWSQSHRTPPLEGGPVRAQAPEQDPSPSEPVLVRIDRPPQGA